MKINRSERNRIVCVTPVYQTHPLDLITRLLIGLLTTMPDTTTTTVNQGENGQYKVTIPKALGDALDLDGEKVEWSVSAGNKLEVKRVD